MNNKYIWAGGFLIVVLIALGFWGGYFNSDKDLLKDKEEDNTNYSIEEYRIEEEGILFEYKSGADGYIVEDLTSFIREQQEDTEVIKAYYLINTREKIELEKSEGAREGPPIINLIIFKNTQNQSASQWVDAFPMFSNTNLIIGAMDRDAVVAGANAVTYRTDGLYQNQNVVIAQGGYIYQFVGSFLEEDSAIYRDFKTLIDSVKFIPNSSSQAKIDIRTACESALAYMTFIDGAAADAFVSDCIEGNHPEVIERYISDMGLDGASI